MVDTYKHKYIYIQIQIHKYKYKHKYRCKYLEVSEEDAKDAVDCGQGCIHPLSRARRNQHQFLKYFQFTFNFMKIII